MATFQIPPLRNDESQAICQLMKSIFEEENRSQQYQKQLESRIREEQATNRQILNHCAWLESVIKQSEQARLQRESALTNLTENQRTLHRDLVIASLKIQELESRVASQKSVNETLLRSLAPGDEGQSRAFNTDDILLENQWQGELISTLQNTLQMQERTITGLQMVLDETCGGDFPGCCSACDISGYQSNAVPDSPCQGILIGDDEETLCEMNTDSRPSVGSP
ncbi:uncharacterized protein ASPGLDRAFT_26445 [Aspergillus glaucus CBS 516.65]|uniref:Uncharacterized protein n=1 Tax=Aspergillus glaucus CBS 516.65 TaxID=1160497 RepID=A0A1L9VHZ4_ASPGL|nr:hypothetical protein ASPGLDRAFT_26445 [Aspergillus glaucus CBS 516.65]OJJ83551.1 hypothetical protein ASPGLDRAFT_26445 [Aspergillus glaucus CBS 516.65]